MDSTTQNLSADSFSKSPSEEKIMTGNRISVDDHLFPYCIVWTPLPLLTWIIPIIGHMGIAVSSGVIHDFAGPYYVSKNDMAFGWPTKYWQLDPSKANGGQLTFDKSVEDASCEYGNRMHNLFCDNCHSHVAMALNKMEYDGSTNWNMVKLCFFMLFHSKYISLWAFIKTWLPFCIILTTAILFGVFLY